MDRNRFNTLVRTHHLEDMREYFNYFDSIKYGNLNFDALWKWSGILDVIFKLEKDVKFDTCVDIGGGLSPIHLILSNYGKVINVDDCSHTDGRCSAWFPVKDNSVFYEESEGFEYKEENIEYVNSDFIKWIKDIPDNSIDLFVDGCSLIHVNPTSEYSFHDGVSEVAHHMKRTLKKGGHFISTCDVYNPKLRENYPSIMRNDGVTFPHFLYKLYNKAGLVPLDEGDYEVEKFYQNFENRVKPVQGAPNHKRLNPEYSTQKHLPRYHAFQQKQDLPMLIARFVFKKD